MKIVLFDDILERHVRRSLARALQDRGHEVLATKPVWKGHKFPRTADLAAIDEEVDRVLEWKPDALLNFRASTLTNKMIRRISAQGVFTMVWYPDDPVLYELCYKHVARTYDLVLHCGGEKVLDFYQNRHGTAGVNFPFWTDNVEFKRSERTFDERTFDVAFLGNLKGPVRRHRYDKIAALPGSVRIFGRLEKDPQSLGQGYLESEADIAETLGHAKMGLNIPQFFSDYAGLPYDFEGLSAFGQFQFPSRVVQYAAIGLPVLSFGRARPPQTFPEMIVANEDQALGEACRKLQEEPDRWSEVARATHARFEASFSADKRARLLELLVTDHAELANQSSAQRARLFAQVD